MSAGRRVTRTANVIPTLIARSIRNVLVDLKIGCMAALSFELPPLKSA